MRTPITANPVARESRRLLAGIVLGTVCAVAGAKEITLPLETALYKESELPGYPIVNGLCSSCHSADYVNTQPPGKPRAFWNGTVVKMKQVFGAPMGDDQVALVVDYLAKVYGDEREDRPAAKAGGG